ncbi:proton-conducting transporter transmembrane domain-containing protein [Candidatus Nitrotoga sp. M5]|uniref:proton-conducting transporter transmembrane domain-containing protein n=1 Tax=Candidatus Nitrotoga sp. M5 TaxID=2890409 RepID=UPI001EF484DF|nr:proton-conducting transporter membrane subunit [Candidatus Nitrotoga sp. M5]CAH1387245.1 NADH dehydrogenase (Quinone) [Candidatus Nitrotoga sp. M5]
MTLLLTSMLQFFIFIPFLGFVFSLFIPAKMENAVSRIVFLTVGLHLVLSWVFLIVWLLNNQPTLERSEITLFKTKDYQFLISFYFDKISAVYLFVGSALTFLVTQYCRWYLHREDGYKRFFNVILFFYIGYNLIVFSGNFETLFVGWEILGFSSFLLISFYRDRYLPVKNALKVFTVFRIADMSLLIAMWMSHALWHKNINFSEFADTQLIIEHLESHPVLGILISLMILLAAAVKSGQFPFSSWVPRAMEGPTPSSAIFYGSLSVHLGVFLLLRTFPFWEHLTSIVITVVILGLTTSIVATGIARVQSSVKTQIAYSSIAQIGLIFIEIALGFHTLALIHFAGNAFLRTYQLLVSPSVVSYMIREQFYNFIPRHYIDKKSVFKKLDYSMYLLCLKEFNLDSFVYRFFWNPLKWVGRKLNFFSGIEIAIFFIATYLIGLICLFNAELIPKEIYEQLPELFALIGLLMVLKAFTERKSALLSLGLVITMHLYRSLAISLNGAINTNEIILYLSGVILSGAVGYVCLNELKSREHNITLGQFLGHSHEYPKLSFIFLLACLGLMAFPMTPTFIGVELIFSHIHEEQAGLVFFAALSYVVTGLALIRIYARIFLGPHIKTYHAHPNRST